MFGSGFLQPTHLLLVLIVVLIVFGPGKLPDVGKALGKSIREFKSATTGDGADKDKDKDKDNSKVEATMAAEKDAEDIDNKK